MASSYPDLKIYPIIYNKSYYSTNILYKLPVLFYFFHQAGKSFSRFVIIQGNCKRFSGADEYHKLFSPGHGRIQQVPLKHDIVLRHQRYNDGRVFRSLGFMNRYGIGKGKFMHFLRFINHFPPFIVNRNLAGFPVNPGNRSDITVKNIFQVVVFKVHDLITG